MIRMVIQYGHRPIEAFREDNPSQPVRERKTGEPEQQVRARAQGRRGAIGPAYDQSHIPAACDPAFEQGGQPGRGEIAASFIEDHLRYHASLL